MRVAGTRRAGKRWQPPNLGNPGTLLGVKFSIFCRFGGCHLFFSLFSPQYCAPHETRLQHAVRQAGVSFRSLEAARHVPSHRRAIWFFVPIRGRCGRSGPNVASIPVRGSQNRINRRNRYGVCFPTTSDRPGQWRRKGHGVFVVWVIRIRRQCDARNCGGLPGLREVNVADGLRRPITRLMEVV